MTADTSIEEIAMPEVLVVDDHKTLLREVSASLRKRHLKVRTAGNGAAALRVIRRENIAVAVIDLKMPRMDGIELAKAIRTVGKRIAVIFLTAFDTEKYRQRAEAEGLQIDCWIDKDPQVGINNTMAAVMYALNRGFVNHVRERLAIAANRAELSPSQLDTLINTVDLPSILNPCMLTIQRQTQDIRAGPAQPLDLDEVVTELIGQIDEVFFGYTDPAHRQLPWDRIRDLASGDLWKAVEHSANPHLKQLVVQFEQAVRRIDAPLLQNKHLEAAVLSLERLRSGKVDQSDVAACKKKWRSAGVDTVPSFRKILSEWEDLYSVEGPDDERSEASTRDDDPAT